MGLGNTSSTHDGMKLSRREFLRLGGGALACATVLGAPAVLTGCSGNSDNGTPATLEVSTNDVVTLDAFAEIEDPTGYFEVKDLAQYTIQSEVR